MVLAVEEAPDLVDKPDDDLGLPGAGCELLGGVVAGGGVDDFGSSPGKPALRDGPTGPLGWLGVWGTGGVVGCCVGIGMENVPPVPARP